MRAAAIAALAALTLSAPLAGQEEPVGVRYDEGFEGRPILGEIYPGWERVGASGFPSYNKIAVIRRPSEAKSGNHFLRMVTQGRNTALQMILRKTVVTPPQFSYQAEVHVRLKGTKKNSAVLSVRWLDRFGKVLTESRSTPVTRAPDWTAIRIRMPHIPAETRWALLRLQFEGTDYHGECHFDDLQLVGRPRIEVTPVGRASAIFRSGEYSRFDISVPRIAVEGTHRLVTRVLDAYDQTVIGRQANEILSGKRIRRSFPLPAGFYQLEVQLMRETSEITRRTIPIAVLGDIRESAEGRFGGVLNPWRGRYQDVAAYTRAMGLRHVKVVIWDRLEGGRDRAPESDEVHTLVRSLIESDAGDAIGVFSHPPPSLFPSADPGTLRQGPLALFASGKHAWKKQVTGLASRLGEWIFVWQVGDDGDPAAVTYAGAADGITALRDVLREARRISSIALPIPLDRAKAWQNPGADVVALNINREETPAPAKINERHHYVLEIPSMGAGDDAQIAQVSDFLKRGIELMTTAGTGARVYVPLIPDDKIGLIDASGHPRAPLLAMRTLNALLHPRHKLSSFNLFGSPVEDRVFVHKNQAVIAFWSTGGDKSYNLYLGPDARLVDPLGGVTPLKPGARVVAGRVPKFLTGVDTLLLQTQAGLQYYDAAKKKGDPDVLNNRIRLQSDAVTKFLKMTNHFADAITNLRIRVQPDRLPHRWKVGPLLLTRDKLAPGEEFREEMNFSLPQTATQGFKSVFLRLQFNRGDKEYDIIVDRVVEVVPDIRILIHQEKVSGQPNARRIRVDIQNMTTRTISARVHAQIPGQPDRPVSASGILPGERMPRALAFYIEDVRPLIRDGRVISVSARDVVGRVFSNRVEPIK